MPTAILLLAAGASRRFGTANKLLAPLDGRPLLRHAADAARAVPADLHLAAVSDPQVADLLPDFRKVLVDPGQPQSASLKAGLALAQAMGATRLLVVLADMPRVPTALMAEVLAKGTTLAAAASDGTRILPPACLPAALFPQLRALTGDQGAGALLKNLPTAQRVLGPAAILIDIDTEADLAALARP
jgi:CTP:molybdopterin cytidylyltransferase MocA